MAEIIINSDNFQQEVLNSDKPVLLDFWASWCRPCRMLAPVVEEISRKYDGRIKVGKINVDDEPSLAQTFEVASIPSLFLIKNGKSVTQSTGFRSQQELEEILNEFI